MWAHIPNHSVRPGNAVASSSKDPFPLYEASIAPVAASRKRRIILSDDEDQGGEETAGLPSSSSGHASFHDDVRSKRVRKKVEYVVDFEDSDGDVSVATDAGVEDQGEEEFKVIDEEGHSDGNFTDGRSEEEEDEA